MPRKKRVGSEVEAEVVEALNRATDQVMGREAEPKVEPVDVLLGHVLAVESVRLADEREAEAQMGDEDDGAPDAAAEQADAYAFPDPCPACGTTYDGGDDCPVCEIRAEGMAAFTANPATHPAAALAIYQAIATGKVKIATWKGRALVSATGETVGSVLLTPNGYGARFGRSERDDDGPEDVCRAWVEAAAVADGWMVLP